MTQYLRIFPVVYGVLGFLFSAYSEEKHWAYSPITKPPLPVVKEKRWPQNGIDYFILRQLEKEGIKPSSEADRSTLIRRLFLDLIGLPPTPEQWRRWVDSTDSNWYVDLVDELLASPHYGERWARIWLDQARYADSDGYEKDQPRPHAYHWRDWVIDAYNSDLPFDQFTEQQIAGDLLPGATGLARLATGFHRNTLTNREGGIDKEEDRVKQVVDRINTTSTVWLGLSVKCAQCHDHKYDAISHSEYFQMYSFFNSSDEVDFPLPATEAQKVAFLTAKRQHEEKLRSTKVNLEKVRNKIISELSEFCEKISKKTPEGIPVPPERGLLEQLDFEDNQSKDQLLTGKGISGQALALDGKTQRLELGQVHGFKDNGPFSLAAWVFLEGESGGIITKMDEAANFRGLDFTIHRGIVEIHLVETWPTNAIKVTSKGSVSKGSWHHVAATYDGSKKADGISIFIDGVRQELQQHYDQLTGSFAIQEPWRVGSRKNGTYFEGRIDGIRIYDRNLAENEIASLRGDPRLQQVIAAAAIDSEQRNDEQTELLIDYALSMEDGAPELRIEIEKLTKNIPKQQHGTGLGLMQRDTPRKTHIHLRGNFLKKGEEVRSGVPKALHPMKVRGVLPDRLDFARWILSSDNTLTARVTVNRIWAQYFGRGIVATDNDFGLQGERPSHPQLLDWIASCFIEDGWSMKSLHRKILNSSTYKQQSVIRSELVDRDPYNTMLAFQNRKRVEAEIVRDLALSVAGLLNTTIKGPSVFPQLPPGIVELAYVDVIERGPWRTSDGPDRYRRGLYTFFQRTSPFPMLTIFDAPDSTVSCTRRERSNTPLQALTLWNDPVLVDCARGLASRILMSDAQDNPNRIREAFAFALSREPKDEEITSLSKLLEITGKFYEADKRSTEKIISGQKLPHGVSPRTFAAWVGVSRAMINLDEFITRE